jgi:hypothetical protein
VAMADPDANRVVIAAFRAEPALLSAALRDEALAALNRAAGTLGLTSADLLAPGDPR